MKTAEFFAFIKERQSIYLKKEAGKPKPWTSDPILQQYKFCNIYREQDRVTKWIVDNWRYPHRDDPHIWFAMVVARLINWPASLASIGYPSPWIPNKFLRTMAVMRENGEKMYTGAYMIHADRAFEATYQYQEAKIFSPMWAARKTFPKKILFLRDVFEWLKQFECMGDFMAAQVIADLKYVPAFNEKLMYDWWTFAAPGPGSRRGLARVCELPTDYKWKEAEWQERLAELRAKIVPLLVKAKMPVMHAQDVQNACCEADKWWRVKLGEGRPRSLYSGLK